MCPSHEPTCAEPSRIGERAGGRGTGLVPIANPARFNWPGYWLAVLDDMDGERPADDRTAVLMFGTPSGVVLSPQDPALLGAAATDLPVREGYVLSRLDPAFTTPGAALPSLRGRVEAIAVAGQATRPMPRWNGRRL